MEEDLRKLSAFVAVHPPDFRSDGGDTILDALFWVYCENAGADCEVVQQGYAIWLLGFERHTKKLSAYGFLRLLRTFSVIISFLCLHSMNSAFNRSNDKVDRFVNSGS